VTVSKISVPYKTAAGIASKEFTIYKTHHGPVVREADGKWVSVRLMQEPLKALQQSYLRTKAKNYKAFKDTMELHTNSSNNTIYADADGSIAYFHSNFIPNRVPTFDWTKPVDGSNAATEWHGVMSVDQSPNLLNPASGWLYNANNWPWSAAGASSLKRTDYPSYVDRGTEESARGFHALRVFDKKKDFTLDGLIAAAYDSYLPAFDVLMPRLLKAYDAAPPSNPLNTKLAEQIKVLRSWDYRWSTTSVPTSLAVYWGEELGRRVGDEARKAGVTADHYMMNSATADEQLQSLAAASDKLAADFGKWNTPWGDINRFQRLTGDIVQPFNDAGPSIPVGFTSSRWARSRPSARAATRTPRRCGNTGNSFVAVVEFGDTVKAKAVSAGGESGDPKSKHFKDQAERYSTGGLRDVYFYPAQLTGHTERQYHPGQ
jgi:acyl-homoserine lactone acylase PvdQ